MAQPTARPSLAPQEPQAPSLLTSNSRAQSSAQPSTSALAQVDLATRYYLSKMCRRMGSGWFLAPVLSPFYQLGMPAPSCSPKTDSRSPKGRQPGSKASHPPPQAPANAPSPGHSRGLGQERGSRQQSPQLLSHIHSSPGCFSPFEWAGRRRAAATWAAEWAQLLQAGTSSSENLEPC